MKYFLQKTWAIFAAAIFLSGLGYYLLPSKESDTLLYLIYDSSRAGEKNQVLGVANALKRDLPTNTLQLEFDLKKKDEFLTDVRSNIKHGSNKKGIVIAAEVESINILRELGAQNNLVISHSSHQWTKDHARLKDVADVVALPRYVVSAEAKDSIESPHTMLVQMTGVPHNLSKDSIHEAYQYSKNSIPNSDKYVGVILGGDAETPDKQMKYYMSEEAIRLANYLVPIIKEKKAHLLILNGPRTGKHEPLSGKLIETSHRNGQLDAVTRAFIQTLKSEGLNQGQDFTLFDFQFGKASAYPAVLGALAATQSPLYVAGESTSMVSESADCLPGLVIAYTNGAMNNNHVMHVLSELSAGRINVLEYRGQQWRLQNAPSVDKKASQSAAQSVADAIQKRMREKSL